MRKKVNLLLLVGLVALLTCVFVACNVDGSKFVDSVPEEIGNGMYSGDENDPQSIDGGYALLQFDFTDEIPSLFKSIIIDENEGYDIEKVKYQVIYTKGGNTTITNYETLKLEYIDEADQALLYKKGHHLIHVSIPYSGSIIKGTFSLHLRYAYDEIEYVTLKFDIDGGKSHFATATNNIAEISVEKGLTFNYDQFVRNFTITKVGYAIKSFDVTGNSVKTLVRSPKTSTEKSSITLDKDAQFKVNWTNNTIKVNYVIDAPIDVNGKEATLAEGASKPYVQDEYVEQSVGTITRPVIDMNAYNGFYFAGWYNKANNQVWNFTNPAGQSDITLYAKWTTRFYTTTLYPMSGSYKANLANSKSAKKNQGTELTSMEIAKNAGYLEAKADTVFDVNGRPQKIDISGLVYDIPYSDYVVEVSISSTDATKTKILILSELFDAFEKPSTNAILNGKIKPDEFLYSTQSCQDSDKVGKNAFVKANRVLYVKWNLDTKDTDNDYLDVMSAFYTDILFKDNLFVKPDGTVKIVDIKDETFCDLIVPDSIKINGVERYISEFGDKSAMNVRSFGTLDFSKAKHLTTIGNEAFINCKNIYSIIWPEENNITKIGKDAFSNTAWEDNYKEDFIVLNNILYKYKDPSTVDNKIESVDMKSYYTEEMVQENYPELEDDALTAKINELNDELASIKTIANGAFGSSLFLKSIILPTSVEKIENEAFAHVKTLTYIEAGTSLKNISATAFDDTLLIENKTLSTSGAKTNTEQLNDGTQIIRVGNVLVRVLDKDITSINIKTIDTITAFAGEAFAGCKNLSEITIDSSARAAIEYIGADAFSTPIKYFQEEMKAYTTEDKKAGYYYSINHILTEYYNPEYNFFDAVVPETITSIGSYAFNSYARYIKTVEIGANVVSIDEYAFVGATNLKSILMSNVKVESNALVNLPAIEELTFANSKGEMINGLTFYFTSGVIEYFKSIEAGTKEATSEIEVDWFNLYKMNKDHFKVEMIDKVYVNTDVVDTVYLISAERNWTEINKGIIKESSAGVIKYATLSADTFEEPFKYAATANAPFNEYTVKIKPREEYGEGAQYIDFTYKVIQAVKGSPSFYQQGESSTIIGSSDFTENYRVKGFDGDVLGASVPTFFTSRRSLDLDEISFVYKDWKGVEHSIVAKDHTSFSPTQNNTNSIEFTFDFYGYGTYKVSFNYKGIEAGLTGIAQNGAISIPLNADVSKELAKSFVDFEYEDGLVSTENINMQDFTITAINGNPDAKNLISNTLGLIEVELTYKGSKKHSSDINTTIVYSIVLEGDASQFVFEIKGVGDNAKAVITSHINKLVETLVIPSFYELNGKQYEVVEIKDEVFKDYASLTTVYLPSTVKKIGAGAFKNCSNIKAIYSSQSISNVQTEIADSDFDILTQDIRINGSVNIASIDMTSGDLVIPALFTFDLDPEDNGSYTSYKTVTAVPKFDGNVFESFNGTLYLDYTEDNYAAVVENLLDKTKNTHNGISVVFMFNDSATVEAINALDEKIQFLQFNDTNIAFVNSQTDPINAEGQAIEMEVNYLFYYVISANQPRKASTQDRHFTIDKNSIVEESETIYQTRKLKSLDSLASSIETIIVGDVYTSENEDGGIHKDIISTTTEIADVITYNSTGFVVYVPDTIYNSYIIKDSDGSPVDVVIYKHGSELLYETKLYITESIEVIGNGAFEGCSSLESVDLTKATALNYIGTDAFKGSAIKSLDLSKTLIVEINNGTFQDCKSLETVMLPETVTYIGESAFNGCTSLNLGPEFFKNIKTIRRDAFIVCTSMTLIDLTQSSIVNVDSTAFNTNGVAIKVPFKAGEKPATWASDWNGLCNVVYAE